MYHVYKTMLIMSSTFHLKARNLTSPTRLQVQRRYTPSSTKTTNTITWMMKTASSSPSLSARVTMSARKALIVEDG